MRGKGLWVSRVREIIEELLGLVRTYGHGSSHGTWSPAVSKVTHSTVSYRFKNKRCAKERCGGKEKVNKGDLSDLLDLLDLQVGASTRELLRARKARPIIVTVRVLPLPSGSARVQERVSYRAFSPPPFPSQDRSGRIGFLPYQGNLHTACGEIDVFPERKEDGIKGQC